MCRSVAAVLNWLLHAGRTCIEPASDYEVDSWLVVRSNVDRGWRVKEGMKEMNFKTEDMNFKTGKNELQD